MLAPRAVKRKAASKGAANAAPAVGTSVVTSVEDDGSTSAIAQQDIQNNSEQEVVAGNGSPIAEESGSVAVGNCNDTEANPVASTSRLALEPTTVDISSAVQDAETSALLCALVEESLSDWGLSAQYPELLHKLQASETGFLHLSNLLSIPSIAKTATSIVEITQALRDTPSDLIQLDDSGFQIRRRQVPEYDLLSSITIAQWAERSFYIENIPKSSKKAQPSISELKALLEKLLGTPVDVLRLPELYTPSEESGKGKQSGPSGPNIGGLFASDNKGSSRVHRSGGEASTRGTEPAHKIPRKYAFPTHGGPFKGFAFVVLRDPVIATEVAKKWTWEDRGQRTRRPQRINAVPEETASEISGPSDESDAEDIVANTDRNTPSSSTSEVSQTLEDSAWNAGMYLMPIERFNALKLEYLRYFREITTIREQYEQTHDNFSRSRRRSLSPPNGNGKLRTPSPERWERKAKSPSPERWERKPLSPRQKAKSVRRYDDDANDYPRGCICFVKRFHPEASTRTLKTLFQAILEREELDTEHLQYVDHPRNVDSCHVRFSDASTASFFASYFSATRRFTHSDPTSSDPSTALQSIKKDTTVRPMEVEVMTGIPEAIYWSKVPVSARFSTNSALATHSAENGDITGAAEPLLSSGKLEAVAPTTAGVDSPNVEEGNASYTNKRDRADVDEDDLPDDSVRPTKQTRTVA